VASVRFVNRQAGLMWLVVAVANTLATPRSAAVTVAAAAGAAVVFTAANSSALILFVLPPGHSSVAPQQCYLPPPLSNVVSVPVLVPDQNFTFRNPAYPGIKATNAVMDYILRYSNCGLIASENRHFQQPHSHLTPHLQRTP